MAEFEARFASQACREYLCQLRMAGGFCGPRCGHDPERCARPKLTVQAAGIKLRCQQALCFQDTGKPLQSWFEPCGGSPARRTGRVHSGSQRVYRHGHRLYGEALESAQPCDLWCGTEEIASACALKLTRLSSELLEEGCDAFKAIQRMCINCSCGNAEDGACIYELGCARGSNASGGQLDRLRRRSRYEPGSVVPRTTGRDQRAHSKAIGSRRTRELFGRLYTYRHECHSGLLPRMCILRGAIQQ